MNYQEDNDPIFHADAAVGFVLRVLATIGGFCFFVAVCLWWGGV